MAVILDLYQNYMKEHSGANIQELLDGLVQAWIDFDPNATGWINLHDVVFLVCNVSEPLGKKGYYETEVRESTRNKLELIKIKGVKVDLQDLFLVKTE
jgi:hypothetical protein